MDRIFAYDAALPLSTDILKTNINALIGLGFLAQDLLGSSTLVSGMGCAPTAPATLSVIVAAGRIYSLQTIDASAYGDLGTNSGLLVKQGIQASPQTLTMTAPSTSGFSVNVLIEAQYTDSDTTPVVYEYFNPTPPYTPPLNGPGGAATPQNTLRQGLVTLTAKAGSAAATGTQTTPAPDSGYVGLWVVTIANGQTQITSGNIVAYTAAPFINETLTQKISAATAQTLFAPIASPHDDTFIVGAGGVTVGQTAFTLTATPPSVHALSVTIDGATLTPTIDYTVTGASATLTTGLTAGQTANFHYSAAVLSIVPSAGVITDAMLSGTSIIGQVGQTFARSAAEIAHSITPSNFAYQAGGNAPGDVRRYGGTAPNIPNSVFYDGSMTQGLIGNAGLYATNLWFTNGTSTSRGQEFANAFEYIASGGGVYGDDNYFGVALYAAAKLTGGSRSVYAFNGVVEIDIALQSSSICIEADVNNNSGTDCNLSQDPLKSTAYDQLQGIRAVSGGTNKPQVGIQITSVGSVNSRWQAGMGIYGWEQFGLQIVQDPDLADSGSFAVGGPCIQTQASANSNNPIIQNITVGGVANFNVLQNGQLQLPNNLALQFQDTAGTWRDCLTVDGSNVTRLICSPTGTGLGLLEDSGGNVKFSWNHTGWAFNSGTPVATPSGYGTPTGGAHQSSFAAGSITLAQLGAWAAQLTIDLESRGIVAA